jgi:hypothetical protein
VLANTAGMDKERMMFCDVQHPMDAETHNIHLENKRGEAFQLGLARWLGGRGLHTTRGIAQLFLGRVVFNVSSHLYVFCCGSGCV